MPAPASPEHKLTGDDIISEILRNLEEGQFKVRYTVIVPYLYRVSLHQSDYDQLRSVLPHLIAEARRALEETLQAHNQRDSGGPALLQRLKLNRSKKPEVEYKRLTHDWQVEFEPDLEERLKPGEIEIYSELGEAPGQNFGVGTSTRRISKSAPVTAEPVAQRSSSPLAPDSSGDETAAASSPTRRAAPPAQSPGGAVLATLRYEDQTGEHVYEMTRDLVVIGRGGRSYWVDLKIDAPHDVSREHCRLRRDPASGRFYLKDVSQFGTTVDGELIPSSVTVDGGEEHDLNREVLLPARARIGLADVLYLNFLVGGS